MVICSWFRLVVGNLSVYRFFCFNFVFVWSHITVFTFSLYHFFFTYVFYPVDWFFHRRLHSFHSLDGCWFGLGLGSRLQRMKGKRKKVRGHSVGGLFQSRNSQV